MGFNVLHTKKTGQSLSSASATKIIDFNRNQDISREMPGCKQFRSVREGGKYVHKRKKLVLENLKEI